MPGIDRIKQLSRDIKDKALLKIINYLISRDDMDDKYLNEEKSLKQMIEYIKGRAQENVHNGMAIIEDEEVYGWAIHYFDESNESLKLDTVSEKKENTECEKKNKQKSEKKVTSEGPLQLTLFDY